MVDISARLRDSLGGRYEIERELGRGGMALVFLARDLKHERPVAIKVIRPELSASLGSDRFLREIKIAAKLQHPHIVPLYDSGQADGLLYYVMPYVEGEALRERLKREKQLPLEDALQISRDMAAALGHAHSHGVVHRDIKPENVLISGEQAMVADFGIAHAVSEAGGETLTDSGMVIGTPAYMSPEQATGEHELDSRSDIYSLGCVLYEMLAGETPFTGPSGQAIIARHVSQPPPSLRIVRPSVPLSVERALEKSLAKVPADRYATAHQFSQALTRVSAAVSLRRVKRWVWATTWSTAAVVVLAFVALVVWPGVFRGESLRPGYFVVGSLVEPGAVQDTYVHRGLVEALRQAVRQLPDATLEESTRVNSQRQERGEPQTIGDWLEITRRLGAAELVLLSITSAGDSTQVEVHRFDARTGESLGRALPVMFAGQVDPNTVIEELAERLFDMPPNSITLPVYGSEEAVREYSAGAIALATFNLREAEGHFLRALDLDRGHARASLWLAQVRMWAGDPPDSWLAAAQRAAESERLAADVDEAARARALFLLASKQLPQACALYDSLVNESRTSFHAWYGLAECHRSDHIVVPDSASPSEWRYRTSFGEAADAYERAFDLAPSFAFAWKQSVLVRLDSVLFTQSNMIRMGLPLSPDTGYFGAFVSLIDDTLAFVPYRLTDVLNAETRAGPLRHREAVQQSQERLGRIVRSWHGAFPDSSAPNWALARTQELEFQLDGRGEALETVRHAGEAAHTAGDSLNAALVETRVLLKLGRFDEARVRALSVLDWWDAPTAEYAREMIGLATLVGWPRRAADLSEASASLLHHDLGEPVRDLPMPVLRRRQRLMAYAAVGAPSDSINALTVSTEDLLRAQESAGTADWLRCRLIGQPLQYAYPVTGQVTGDTTCWGTSYILKMQWSANTGDTAGVVESIRWLDDVRSDQRPGDAAIDGVYQEAWVALQVGDTAWATSHLDLALAALETSGLDLLRQPEQAAGLVRAMALRAELAAAAGDERTARQWAEPVVALWGETREAELQEVIARMREVSGS